VRQCLPPDAALYVVHSCLYQHRLLVVYVVLELPYFLNEIRGSSLYLALDGSFSLLVVETKVALGLPLEGLRVEGEVISAQAVEVDVLVSIQFGG